MADEHVEGNSPRNTSEATPPHVDDSPEMVSQPSPPEDERVTSSSDCQPPNVADFPVEQEVSSSCEQDQSVGTEPSSPEEASAGQIVSDPAPEIENPSCRQSEPTHLMNTPPKSFVRNEPVSLEELGEAIEEAVRVSEQSATKRNTAEKSDDANQQSDVKDLLPASKCSSGSVLGSDSTPTGSGGSQDEGRGSGSSATVEAGLGSNSSPRITIGIEEKSSLGIGTAENVSLEGELPSSKTSLAIPVSGAMNVGLKSESSPSKISTPSVEGSSSATGVLQEKVSPKRKIPSNDQHLPPKRSTPSTSPGKLQKQSDAQMSTLLEDLDIKETKGEPGSSEPISGHERNIEMEESKESETGETEQESNMEVDETDPQEAQGETTEKYSKKDDTEMKDGE